MTVRVRYFAGAAGAAGVTEETLVAGSLGDLLERARGLHGAGLGEVLARCFVMVDGVPTDDVDAPLRDGSVVDVLPPFAGG